MRKVMSDFEKKISEREAARRLGLSPQVLRRMRLQGLIEYHQMGQCRIRYRESVVKAFEEKTKVVPKADLLQFLGSDTTVDECQQG